MLQLRVVRVLKRNGAESGHRKLKLLNEDGEDTDKTKNVREAHLIVAALIATVTFAAGFTIPGGYQGDKGPEQGFAVLSRKAAFKAFVITNTLALGMSSLSVLMNLNISMYTKTWWFSQMFDFRMAVSITMLALILMVGAFITGTYAVLCHSPGLAITACVIGCFFLLILTHRTLFVYRRLVFLEAHR